MDASYSSLPSLTLDRRAGPVSDAFVERGVLTLRAAAFWLHRLPYGANLDTSDNAALFREGRGTCYTKHGVMAELAEELGFPLHKYLSFYFCGPGYYPGCAEYLARLGLRGVPRIHCVLMAHGTLIDLTAGNCHGKEMDVAFEDVLVRCKPHMRAEEIRVCYDMIYPLFQDRYPELWDFPSERAWAASNEIGEFSRTGCAIPR